MNDYQGWLAVAVLIAGCGNAILVVHLIAKIKEITREHAALFDIASAARQKNSAEHQQLIAMVHEYHLITLSQYDEHRATFGKMVIGLNNYYDR